MSTAGKKSTKKRTNQGLITSLHVMHPGQLKDIRKAAELRDESVSKFLLAAGAKEAAKILHGNCPTCGGPMVKHKTHGKGEKKAA